MKYAIFITDEKSENLKRVTKWVEGKVSARNRMKEIVAMMNEPCRLEMHAFAEGGNLEVKISFTADEGETKPKAEEAPPIEDENITVSEAEEEKENDKPFFSKEQYQQAEVRTADERVIVTIGGVKLERAFKDQMAAARTASGLRSVLATGEAPKGLDLFSPRL